MKISRSPYSVTVPLSIFLATLVTVHGYSDLHPSQYCRNVKCRTAAGEILLSHNRSVNPCTDFYEHACGGWNKHQFSYLTLKINHEISDLFKNIQSSDIETLKKSKRFYDACMDWDAIERKDLKALEKFLVDNGEWPITLPSEDWNPDRSITWQEVHENFAKRVGVSVLFDVTVDIDPINTSARVLTLSLQGIQSDRVQFLNQTKSLAQDHNYEIYFGATVEIMTMSRGLVFGVGDLYDDAQGIRKLENDIDALTILPDDDDNESGNFFRHTNIETLQKDWDATVPNDKFYSVREARYAKFDTTPYSIDWLKLINDRFESTGITVDTSEKIILKPQNFVEKLATILSDTPLRTIVNYLHWKVVDSLLPLTNARRLNPQLSRGSSTDRSEICINNHRMIHAVSYMYVKAQFSVKSGEAAREIVKEVQDEIKQEIRNSSWLDEATKSVAREKIDAMTIFIGYPEWYNESGKIDEYYDELTVGSDYFENVLAADKFEVKKKLSKLRSPVSKSEPEWIAPSHIVNVEYDRQTNSLSLPAAILQSPVLAYEIYSALNYGSLGAIVGYEMYHALDTKGQLYDKNGNKINSWTQSSIETYKTNEQCFVEQYNSYKLHDDPTNSKTTRMNDPQRHRENIADTIGFRAGLRAYQRAKSNKRINDLKIRLLRTFSDEQLYFYKLAHTMCESASNQHARAHVSDSESPIRFRLNSALSNIREFADAFECPIGSSMNPLKKCLMWDSVKTPTVVSAP